MEVVGQMTNEQLGLLLAFAGLVLPTLIGYIISKRGLRDPRPMFIVTGNSVVRASRDDGISVTLDGATVDRVTRTFIVFWNAGRGSIRREDTRKPVRFALTHGKIFRAQLVATTRSDIEPSVEILSPDHESIEVAYSHLDHLDGICIEILHTGVDAIRHQSQRGHNWRKAWPHPHPNSSLQRKSPNDCDLQHSGH